MLSIYTLKSASEASKYYQQADYYSHGSENTHSLWLGKGAQTLGLQGLVEIEVFKGLLQGRLPSGEEMIQVKKGGHHRPGYDLTFSAPKSVSILALVAEVPEVLQAHQEAVFEVVDKIEKNYAACRNKKNGNISVEKTGNLLMAAFEHKDSRAGDPNLHTHCVLMNMTQRKDGVWRTIFGDELYNDKLINGMEYRSILAQKLMHLGYELNIEKKGTFEIVGVPEIVLNNFSKRRLQIEKWLSHQELTGGEAASRANFHTRNKKMNTNEEQLKIKWVKELEASGSCLDELNQISKVATERGPTKLPDPYLIAERSVTDAVEHLSQRQSTYTIHEIIKSAKKFSFLPSSDGDFLKIIEQKIIDKKLLFIQDNRLVTPQAFKLETQNVDLMLSGRRSIKAMLSPWIANYAARSRLVTEEQQRALSFMLTTKDQQILVSANSKNSLTDVLKIFNEICLNQRYFPRLLTQRKINIEHLARKTGIEKISTIEGFLLSCEMRAEHQKQPSNRLVGCLQDWTKRIQKHEARNVWVVDGEVSHQQINRLQHWSKHFGARLIFTGTKYSDNSAIGSLKNKGLSSIQISDSKLLKDSLPVQHGLLENMKGLQTNNAIHSISDNDGRVKSTVENFELGTILVTQNNIQRKQLNELVREKLTEQGYLSQEKTVMDVLQTITLSNEEKRHAHLYNLNDIIRFNRDRPGTLIAKDGYFVIKNINLKSGLIELHNQKNDQVFWDPSKERTKHIEVFRAEKRDISIADRLICTRTIKHESDKTLSFIKDQMVTVSAIQQNSLSIILANGKTATLELPKLQYQHFDHGYAVLLKNAEIAPFGRVNLCLQSNTIDEKAAQDLSGVVNIALESSKSVQIFCDDIDKLKKVVSESSPGKSSMLEVPYARKEALKDNQTTVTQQVFHGLQVEYLQARQLNPEFLDKGAPRVEKNHHYSPEFREACDAVDYVVLHHSERQSVFSLKTVKKEAYELAGIKVPTRVIDGAIDCALARGWLVKVPHLNTNESTDTLVCARHTLLMEKLCIQKMKEGQNQLMPIISKESSHLQEIQEHSRLTKGQKEAISLILTTKDKVVAVQGVAGAGKTTALREINKYCQMQEFNPFVLASTGSARNQAQKASGIPSMTTTQFLTRVESLLTTDCDKAQKEFGGNRLIILDEFSLISTKDMLRLLTTVEKLDVRLSIIGDIKQIGSIGAGEISRNLLAYGITNAAMVENVRLKHPTAFEAMKHAYAGNMSKTLYMLRDSIEEIPVKSEALSRIVDIYTSLKPQRREHTLIITPLNEDRNHVNQAIREKLKEQGELQGGPLTTNVFLPCDRHEVEKSNVLSFQVGDYIRFNTQYSRLGIKAGEYREVCEIDVNHHRLILKNDQNERRYWSTQSLKRTSDIEIYRQDKRELMQNDIVIFKRNNEALGIYNGDKAQVLEINGPSISASLLDGKIITLDLSKPEHQHLDYGYALTAYAGQGRDVDFVLAYGDGPKALTKKENALKVGDTIVLPKEMQPRDEFTINSKLVSVQSIQSQLLILKDSEGRSYTIQAEKDRNWDYFPPFEGRRDTELPLSTTQKSFLVQITRGDNLCLVVPNINDFQKTLEKHKGNEGSAIQHFDPRWSKVNQAVERMVENIKGKAERKDEVEISNKAVIKESLKKKSSNIVLKSSICSNTIQPWIDIDKLERHLADNALVYATRWLGSANRVTGREARWGRKGSFALTLTGPKSGAWRNHEIGKGGKGLVSLYMEIHNIGWKEAIKELAKESNFSTQNIQHTPKTLPRDTDAKLEQHKKDKIRCARKLYNQSIPIQGTLAEKYLREARGISGSLPSDFRFKAGIRHLDTLKPTPALIAPYRDKNNDIVGLVRVFLSPDGGKYKETFVDATGKEIKATKKANIGLSSSGSVVVQRGKMTDSVWIAEGVETALSVSSAIPNQTVVASLSVHQLKNVPVDPIVQKVIICADNDPESSKTKQSIIDAVERHLSEGRRVFIATPSEIPLGMKKCDFNDLIKQGGVTEVQKVLDQKIEIKSAEVLKTEESRLATILKNMPREEQSCSVKLDRLHTERPLFRDVNREFER